MATSHIRVQGAGFSLARSVLVALAAAAAAAAVWFLGVSLLGYVSWLRNYLGVLSLGVGAGAAYGALWGANEHRGWRIQAISVLAAVVMLAIGQAWVTRLVIIRDAATVLDVHGAAIIAPVSTYWRVMSIGLFGTNPPGIVYWGIAIGYAIAIPRARDEF